MFMISWNSVIAQAYHPPVFFLAGLLGSVLICLLSPAARSVLRFRRHGDPTLAAGDRNYQRFRDELISSPRHIGFADSILELDDQDLRVE
ncbi:hypothetical protein [Schlesneria paludicola]|uniref:hypothetical protein n=1 Tax=Schlesneria paludicola TaxID=360056 RepID=UPI000299E653|nr:hypothetical protein [Schlesneria paludicola]